MHDEITREIEKQQQRLEALEGLKDSILVMRPSEADWSIAECIKHMNLAMEIYLDQFDEMQDQLKPEKKPYKPAFLAKHLIRSQPPDKKGKIRFKIQTMKRLDPRRTGPPADRASLKVLRQNLSRLQEFAKSMKGKDARSFKVETVIGPILKLYVGDALRFIHAHNQRHFQQIDNIRHKVESHM